MYFSLLQEELVKHDMKAEEHVLTLMKRLDVTLVKYYKMLHIYWALPAEVRKKRSGNKITHAGERASRHYQKLVPFLKRLAAVRYDAASPPDFSDKDAKFRKHLEKFEKSTDKFVNSVRHSESLPCSFTRSSSFFGLMIVRMNLTQLYKYGPTNLVKKLSEAYVPDKQFPTPDLKYPKVERSCNIL